MLFNSVLFSLYFIVLFLFCVVTSPIYYCCLLVINALIASLICYGVFGFGWYSLLFCLVYIGGVYILFVFVSIFNPNNDLVPYYSVNASYVVFMFLFLIFGFVLYYSLLVMEYSSSLCTVNEGGFYVFMCMTLVFGFIVLSLVMSFKPNYYR